MPVISAVALKGGVGKTTFVHMAAGALVTMGRRVLCLDNDPQASLSSGMFGPSVVESMNPGETIAALYSGDDPLPGAIIRPSGVEGIDIVPGSRAAADFNTPRPHTAPLAIQTCLRGFVDEIRDQYDVVLIDNPPQLSAATWAALLASDYLTVQTVPEDYGSASLSPVFEILRMISGPNPDLHMLGLVLTMVQPRLTVHQVYEAMLRDQHGERVYETRIPLATDVKEAILRRLPVTHHKPRGAASKAFKAVVVETFARIESHQAGGRITAIQPEPNQDQTPGEAA